MAGAGGLGWPDPAVLGGWNALQEARAWVGVPDNVWEVLLRQTGMYDAAVEGEPEGGLRVHLTSPRSYDPSALAPFLQQAKGAVDVAPDGIRLDL